MSCTERKDIEFGTQTFRIEVVQVNGADLPSKEAPLPANTGKSLETWEVNIEAIGADGKAIDFDGFLRLSVQPGAVGAVVAVETSTGESFGRNVLLRDGKASVTVSVTGVYGPSRLWAEDLGYTPAEEGKTPACANGKNDDPEDDVRVDFPNDPGCAFADDDSEAEGTFAAGVSNPVHYALPTLQDIQGGASLTPYPFESMQVNTSGIHELVVTRIAKDGFYVTDLAGQASGYNHMFAFNFQTPRGMRVCDRITYLSGTVVEFFGFTEMSFPSFEVDPLFEGQEDLCKVPEAVVLGAETIDSAAGMEALESGLVRLEGYRIPANFGANPALNNVFAAEQSNCDLNGDGRVDFENAAEASCGNACSADRECVEWTGYASRGNYKVYKEEIDDMGVVRVAVMQVQTDGAPAFNPTQHRGETLTSVTGTMRNFSGGSLNWTVEARCTDDLVCGFEGCSEAIKGPKEACVALRTEGDNDAGTN